MLDSKSRISKTERFMKRKIDGELIFFSESGLEIHTMADTALFIYECIKDETAVSIIIDTVCDEYDIDMKTAEKDVIDFLTDLFDKGIIAESR